MMPGLKNYMLEPEEMARRLQRHFHFWDRRYEGEGAYISITAPDEKQLAVYPAIAPPKDLETKWFDIDYRLKRYDWDLQTTYYAGDAVPCVNVDFGPGVLAAMLGADYRLDEHTIWFGTGPLLMGRQDLDRLEVQVNGKAYRAVMELTRRLCEHAKGRYAVGVADAGMNLDVLASLYGREKLLLDILRCPDAIRAMLRRIDSWWARVVDDNYRIIERYTGCAASWIPIANQRRWYPLLSEFSAMISPVMFEQIVLPALQREAASLKQVLFNLDGEEAIRHLPLIKQIIGLHAIEWDPVPQYSTAKRLIYKQFTSKTSIEACRQIQAYNLKLVINGILPEEVPAILRHISPDGVFFIVSCDSRKSADEFYDQVSPWMRL